MRYHRGMAAEQGIRLRERTRRAVRTELISIGMGLFASNGYDETTVEQIATTAGMSKRSFFRYFASKEDLVLGNVEAVGRQLAQALAARPDDEPPWLAMRHAFDLLVSLNDADPRRALVLLRMLRDTPSLKARRLEKQLRWQELLTPHLSRGSVAGGNDPRPRAIAAAALACLDAAQEAWVASDGTVALSRLLDMTMKAVGPL